MAMRKELFNTWREPLPLWGLLAQHGGHLAVCCIPTAELPQGQPSAKLIHTLRNGMSQSGPNLGASAFVQAKTNLI